jgi:ABC-type multidrug transport system ATPase subunit
MTGQAVFFIPLAFSSNSFDQTTRSEGLGTVNTLNLKDIVVSRGKKLVLNGLKASADKGDVVALLGPNGAGKTTLLHFIAGVLKGDSGDILYEGGRINTTSPDWRRALTYVLDDGGVIPLLTAEEQIYLQSVLSGTSHVESIERTMFVIDLLELGRYRDYRGNELSSGVRKRLGIGMGIVSDADVFLFDEPYSSLDLQATAVFDQILKTLKKRGRIVLVASHSFPFADTLYNRVWSLSAGVMRDYSNEQEARDRLNHQFPSGDSSGHDEFDIPWIVQSV